MIGVGFCFFVSTGKWYKNKGESRPAEIEDRGIAVSWNFAFHTRWISLPAGGAPFPRNIKEEGQWTPRGSTTAQGARGPPQLVEKEREVW